jgi:hypothetical protein
LLGRPYYNVKAKEQMAGIVAERRIFLSRTLKTCIAMLILMDWACRLPSSGLLSE